MLSENIIVLTVHTYQFALMKNTQDVVTKYIYTSI